MTKFSCIIVDDELIGRIELQSYAKRSGRFDIAGVFSSPEEALAFLEQNKVDVLFLDIDMPEMSGLQLREKAKETTACVFVSNHTEYAMEAFALDTLDFLSKPIDPQRFLQMTERVASYVEIKNKAVGFDLISQTQNGTIRVTENYRKVLIPVTEIVYVEAMQNYTRIVTLVKEYTILFGFGSLLDDNRFRSFVRIHRSFAVQKQFVESTGANGIQMKNGVTLPVGRNFRDSVKQI